MIWERYWISIKVNGKLNEETFQALTETSGLNISDEIFWLGILSAKHESNGHPGTISHGIGDSGGVSYGAYQFSSTIGIPVNFVEWLKDKNMDFYIRLKQALAKDGNKCGENFNSTWSDIADKYYIEF